MVEGPRVETDSREVGWAHSGPEAAKAESKFTAPTCCPGSAQMERAALHRPSQTH